MGILKEERSINSEERMRKNREKNKLGATWLPRESNKSFQGRKGVERKVSRSEAGGQVQEEDK